MAVYETLEGFTWGCDPELFIVNSNGEPISAEGIIPGTKEDPYPVAGGAVQLDGVAAEFNIDPVDNFKDFSANIDKVLTEMQKMIPAGHSLVARPSVVFSEKEWDKVSPQAKALGCTPDFNAWTGEVNPPPDGEAIPRMRTGSGHIHVGWRKTGDLDIDHVNNCRDLVRQFDFYLGAWSALQDKDKVRRQLYGKAGACRFKPYGVEYRVLSNFWVLEPSYRLAVWNRAQKALEDMQKRYLPVKKLRGCDVPKLLMKGIEESNIDAIMMKYFEFPIRTINTDYSHF